MAIGDEVTLRVVGRYQNQNVVNTFHYKIGAQASSEQTILNNLCVLWDAANTAAWVLRHLSDYVLVGIKAFGKEGAAKIPGYKIIGTAGGVTGTSLPALICRVITFYTASANHRRHGRAMLSGTDEAMLEGTDGSVTATEVGLLDTLATALTTALTGDDDEFVPIIPSTDVLPLEEIIGFKSRVTPASITSRRIRRFLVG